MSSQLGRQRDRDRDAAWRHARVQRGRRIEALVIRVLNAWARLDVDAHAEERAAASLRQLVQGEKVAIVAIVQFCGGALTRTDVGRLVKDSRPRMTPMEPEAQESLHVPKM